MTDEKKKSYEKVERPVQSRRGSVWLTAEIDAMILATLEGGGAIRLTEEAMQGRMKNSVVLTLRDRYQKDGVLAKIRKDGAMEGALLVWLENTDKKV